MKKLIAVLIIGLCIGFTIGAFTGLHLGKKDRSIASNSEYYNRQLTLPDMELYLETLKNAKSHPVAMPDSTVFKELIEQMAIVKSQPPVNFDSIVNNEIVEKLRKEMSEK